jgi:hypothetical protein
LKKRRENGVVPGGPTPRRRFILFAASPSTLHGAVPTETAMCAGEAHAGVLSRPSLSGSTASAAGSAPLCVRRTPSAHVLLPHASASTIAARRAWASGPMAPAAACKRIDASCGVRRICSTASGCKESPRGSLRAVLTRVRVAPPPPCPVSPLPCPPPLRPPAPVSAPSAPRALLSTHSHAKTRSTVARMDAGESVSQPRPPLGSV